MKSVMNRSRMGARVKRYFKGPFTAFVVSSEKQSDRILYTVQGMGDGEREEIEVFAGAPIIEWLAKGVVVLIVPHLLRSAELFIVAKAQLSELIDELAEEGDFAIERDAGTYALFKKDEITLEASDILLGKNASKAVALHDDDTTATVVGDHGSHTHKIVASATVVKAK